MHIQVDHYLWKCVWGTLVPLTPGALASTCLSHYHFLPRLLLSFFHPLSHSFQHKSGHVIFLLKNFHWLPILFGAKNVNMGEDLDMVLFLTPSDLWPNVRETFPDTLYKTATTRPQSLSAHLNPSFLHHLHCHSLRRHIFTYFKKTCLYWGMIDLKKAVHI